LDPRERYSIPESLLDRVRALQGWLSDREAALLYAVAAHSASQYPDSAAIVEVGSYCGKSTVALASGARSTSPGTRVYAVDPHEGVISRPGGYIEAGEPTLESFQRAIAQLGLTTNVRPIVRPSYQVEWSGPISLLFLDGLHDYLSVSRDYFHFARSVPAGAWIAFHDYGRAFPDVRTFVDELIRAGHGRIAWRAGVLVVLVKLG
jgi:hypothetical protein